MPFSRNRKVPVFPKIVVTNTSGQVLYLGVKAKGVNGVWLAASGDGSQVVLQGVDLSDRRVTRTLQDLQAKGRISLALVEPLASAFPTTTTTPGP